MGTAQWSVAVILNVNGSTLDSKAVADVPLGRLVRAEFAHGERAACVAVTLEHDCDPASLSRALRSWASVRGWSVTVAPLNGRG
jgi:hypothetical protein